MNDRDTEPSALSVNPLAPNRSSPVGAVRLGIIGCSLGRARYHLALQACPSIRIAGIADSDERSTRIWARDIGNRVPAYADIPDLLAASHSFDALLVASPLDQRDTHLLAAIALGKPILAEVPFALHLNTVSSLAQTAQDTGLLLMPALPRPLDPWFEAATAQLLAGTIGTLLQIRCHWSFPLENVDETEDIVTGGWNGLIQALGSQTADLARRWLGAGLAVSGDIDFDELRRTARNQAQHRRPADRSIANLIVTHEQGQSTHHFSRTRSVQPDERYLFAGSTGNLELIVSAGATAASTTAPSLTLQRPGQRTKILPVKPEPILFAKTPISPSTARIVHMLTHFAGCVQTNTSSIITAQDAFAALEILQAAYRSTTDRVKINLPLLRPPDIARLLLPPDTPATSHSALPPGNK